MSPEANKELVRRFFADIDALSPTLHDDYFADDYTDHTPPPVPGIAPGIEGARQLYAVRQRAFSDPWHSIEEQIADGDLVLTRLTAGGRHTGELFGIPATGKDVHMSGMDIFRVVDGRITDRWAVEDLLALLVQLGAVALPGSPATS